MEVAQGSECLAGFGLLAQKSEMGDIYYVYSQRVNLGVVRQDENAWWSPRRM